MIDPAVREALLAKVHSVWPPTWAEAVKKGITVNNVLSGAPIAEYRPERLARGRLAVIGDAAHVVSPMTGRGYLTGVEDAEILGQSLADTQHFRDVPAALANYESARLPYVRGLVAHSIRISGDFRQYAARA